MRVSLWILLCIVLAVWRRKDPFPLLLAAVAMWILLPYEAASRVTGQAPDLLDMHPGSWLLLVLACVQACLCPRRWARVTLARFEIVVLMTVPFVVAWITGLFSVGGAGQMSHAGEQLLTPALAFLLVGVGLRGRPGRSSWLTGMFLLLGVFETGLAQVQALIGSPVPYVDEVTQQYWYSDTFGRWMGTFNHPLTLSVFLTVCIALTVRLHTWWLRIVLVLVFFYGELLTQSRFGLGAAAVATAYAMVFGRGGRLGRIVPTVVIAGIAVYATGAGWFDTVVARFADDTTSTQARAYGAQVWWDQLGHYVWTGLGLGSSFDVSYANGVGASFENSFFIMTVDIGLMATLMLFGSVILCYLWALGRERVPGPAVAGLLLVISLQSFSAMGARVPLTLLLFVLAGVCAYEPLRPRRRTPARPAAAPAAVTGGRRRAATPVSG